jgi:hypothetical protein
MFLHLPSILLHAPSLSLQPKSDVSASFVSQPKGALQHAFPVFLLLFTGNGNDARPRATKCLTARNRIFHEFCIHRNCVEGPGEPPRAFFIAA